MRGTAPRCWNCAASSTTLTRESFWSMLKRAHKGTFRRPSVKHLHRYVDEFPGRRNIRDLDTIRQMEHVVARKVGKRLMYRDVITDNSQSARAS